jgi:hypothetical protein
MQSATSWAEEMKPIGASLAVTIAACAALMFAGTASHRGTFPPVGVGPAVRQALEKVEQSDEAKQLLGDSVRAVWQRGGAAWVEGGVADFYAEVQGSKGRGRMHARGLNRNGQLQFQSLSISSRDVIIDVGNRLVSHQVQGRR